ncbi:hypothetical protein ACFDWB_004958 [Salmonella enterica]|nr:hypothetical protein [Salmonella enterica]
MGKRTHHRGTGVTVKRVRFLTKKGPSVTAGKDYTAREAGFRVWELYGDCSFGENDLFHWNSTEVVTVTEQHQAEEITSFDISPANGSELPLMQHGITC